jgi:hypothetical protein
MSAFYVLFDALDDFCFRKENESDAALFARMSGPTSQGESAHCIELSRLFITPEVELLTAFEWQLGC